MKNVKVEIKGMSCSSCEGHVKTELEKIGAKKIKVSAKDKFAEFNITEEANKEIIIKAISAAGYAPVKVVFTESKKGFFGRLFK